MRRACIFSWPRLLLAAAIAGAGGFLFSFAAVAAASEDALPGSAADPLVTQAWVEYYVQESFAPLYQRLEQMEQKLSGVVKIVLTIDEGQALVNGKIIPVPAPPRIMGGGYTMAPARFIGEALGLQVDWQADSRRVTFSGQGQDISLTIGRADATINGQSYSMAMPPLIAGGYTLVHVRFVSEAFHCQVKWDAAARQVIISK